MDSHVLNSKSIIKNFKISETNGNVYSLNLNTWEIEDKKGPNGIGTILDYFDKETEDYLSKNVERPLGLIVKKLKENELNKNVFTLNENEIDHIRNFLTVLLCREPSIIEKTYEKSLIVKELGIKLTPSKFIKLVNNTQLKHIYFGNHYPVIVFNESNVSFISSISGFHLWKSIYDKINWWFPVTPTIAIDFVDELTFKNLYQYSSCAIVSESLVAQNHNNNMLENELKSTFKIIFSNDINEINRIKDYYEPK